MKKDYNIEEKIAVEEAMKALYLYNNACRFTIEEKYLEEDLLTEYFLSDDEQFCKDCEKRIGAAAIQYCYDNPDILNKKQNAKLMSSQIIDAVQAAKIEAEWNLGKLGKGVVADAKREELKREHSVVQKSVWIANAKKGLLDMPQKITKAAIKHSVTPVIVASIASHGALGATIAAGSVTILGVTIGTPLLVGAAVGVAMSLTYETVKYLTPKHVKEAIKSKAKEVMTKTVNVIEKNVQRLMNTPVGKKVSAFVKEKVAPIVSKGADLFERGYEKAKSSLKSGWTKVKSLIPFR